MRLARGLAFAATALVATACTSHHPSAGASGVTSSLAASSTASAGLSPSGSPTAASGANPPPTGKLSQAAARASVSVAHPCGVAPAGTHYTHVVWIWMENKPYSSVIGNRSAPYENALARQCGLATDYHGITHPSLPNYLAATGGSTFGVHDDSGPSSHPINADSIFGQLDRAGLAWRSYEESMPTNCATSANSPYAVKHNPAAYFTRLRASCEAHDVPLAGNLDRDIAAGSLPSFSFVTPNLCSDTHDCSVHTGDTWLATWIPKILGGPNYRAGNTLVVLTWDEGVGSGNQIPTIVVAPSVRSGTTVGVRLDHYALLRGTEDVLGLSHLGAAASAPSLAAAFGL